MTAALASASTSFGIRARDTYVNWMIPSECEPRIEFTEGRPELVVSASGTLDPQTAVFGRPLDALSWDVTARNEFLGAINQRPLRTALPARCAIRTGRVYVAYKSNKGMLSLDVDQTNRSLTGSAPLDPVRAETSSTPSGHFWSRPRSYRIDLRIPFGAVATADDSVIDGMVHLDDLSAFGARIIARDRALWLESSVQAVPGRYRLRLAFQAREFDSGLDLEVDPRGKPTISRPGT